MASLLAGTFFAVANCCELGFFLSRGHFGVGRFARRGSTRSCEGRLPFSRSSPPGHAAVRRCGGRECSDRVRNSGVSRRGGCVDLLGGG